MVSAVTPTLLLIDDSELVLKAVAQHLTARGLYVVTTSQPKIASDLAEGLENLIAIVLDVDMPEVDGGMLSKTFRQNAKFRDVPIIFYSGLRDEKTNKLLEEVAGTSRVSKTTGLEALWQEIQNVSSLGGANARSRKRTVSVPGRSSDDEILLDEIFDGLLEEVPEPIDRATLRPVQSVDATLTSLEDKDETDSAHTRATVRPPDAQELAKRKFKESE